MGSPSSVLIFPPRHVSAYRYGDLPPHQPARLDPVFHPRAQTTLLRHSFSQTITAGTGISTSCPSSTPFGLDLGPDLPWADDPSPGILRLSADKILTCLLVTHVSILSSVNSTEPFNSASPLTQCSSTTCIFIQVQSFGTVLQPRLIFGAEPLDQ